MEDVVVVAVLEGGQAVDDADVGAVDVRLLGATAEALAARVRVPTQTVTYNEP